MSLQHQPPSPASAWVRVRAAAAFRIVSPALAAVIVFAVAPKEQDLNICLQNQTDLLPPMSVALPFRVVFAVSAVAATCFACLLTFLKSALYWECRAPGGGSLRPVIIACVVAAALSVAASAAYVLKSRALSWTFATAVISKWQPVYFVFASVERLILRAIVTHAVSVDGGPSGSCSEHKDAVHAVCWMWACATCMIALSALGCDMNAEASPALRRCGYGLLALVLVLDGIGSVVWGNPFAGYVSISMANLELFLNNQLTSCITSQAVMALHFLYVSCRSRHGRGWAYASLRFELDERGRSTLLEGGATATKCSTDSGAGACAAMAELGSRPPAAAPLQRAGAARASALRRLRERWREFQRWQESRCRVFVIPCVRLGDGGGGGEGEVVLARPAFGLRWLAPLQRLADVHPRMYWVFTFVFVIVPLISTTFINDGGLGILVVAFVLNFLMLIVILGFLSSKRFNLDRVAAKHVVLSFRFVSIAILLVTDVALLLWQAFTSQQSAWISFFGQSLIWVHFCCSLFLDCSPHLPPVVQFFISVCARNVTYRSVCLLSLSAGWVVHCARKSSNFNFSVSYRQP
jgi:hypothetical protein